jgi:hypothetical protein
MSVSDWVLIITTLFLGVIAIWGDRIRHALYPPKITVLFDEVAPYCQKTYYRSSPADMLTAINEPVFFFRFEVENTGETKLTGCEAVLEQLWIYNSAGKPQKLHGFNDVTLVWINGRRPRTDLSPHRRDFCNIGHVASPKYQTEFESNKNINAPGSNNPELKFIFELAEYPHSQTNSLAPGKYAIKVVLYSENTGPKELWFEIAWSGKWQDNETEMFRELTINQIQSLE